MLDYLNKAKVNWIKIKEEEQIHREREMPCFHISKLKNESKKNKMR